MHFIVEVTDGPRYRAVVAAATTPEPPEAEDQALWLTPGEKAAWSGLISLVLLLPGRLESPLQRGARLTLFEYLTLSHVSEAPGRRLRMSELAFLANGSLSRLSNVISRLERRGWVRRAADPDDGRYTLVALTDDGYDVVVVAAPTHVRAVRQYVLDPLTESEQRSLTRIAAKLRAAAVDGP